MGMSEVVMKLWWKPGVPGFHKDKPDAFMAEFRLFILEKRKTPTPKTRVFAMLLQHRSFYLLGDFTMRLMWCCRAILACMIFIIAG